MLLLLADSSLLIFITLTLGVLARESLSRLFRSPVNAGLLELFLLGLIMSSLYFNILSFWLPVDYRTLLPPALLGLAGNILYKEKFRGVWASIRDNLVLFFSPSQRPLTIAVGIVLLAYWILPCGTPDSILYHCQSILWYEKYKIVPGLANLNADCWLTPLKSIWHDEKQKEDFPYYLLKNGVRLYMADAKHQCVNACLPCMQWSYGEVEMRGTRIDQGFRNTRYRFGGFPVPVLPTPEK